MATLKEIKARIGSVQRTLKITSVMKMVASAKFHRAQTAYKAHTLYHQKLGEIFQAVYASPKAVSSSLISQREERRRAVVVAFASSNSLCGRFNANAIKTMDTAVGKLREEGFQTVSVVSVGEKMRQALVKGSYEVDASLQSLLGKDAAEGISALGEALIRQYETGETDRIVLVYNHFRSMGHQEPQIEQFLPMTLPDVPEDELQPDYIFEPQPALLLARLLPVALGAHLQSVFLDTSMAEHAARTVAMQTATDNAQELLDELSLSYNKQRQQAITNELADITQAGS